MEGPLHDAERLLASAGWVRRLALGLAGDAHEAEDLVQDALVVALEKGPAREGALEAWFGGVLRHLAEKRRRANERRRRRETRAARDETQQGEGVLLERVSMHQALVSAVMELGEPCRSAIVLRYLDELPPRAIARQLGLPLNTVRARLQRGLAELRRRLDARAGGRERWLPAVLALGEAPRVAGPTAAGASGAAGAGGALLMSAKTKLVAAAAVSLVGLWAGWRVLGRERAGEPVESTARADLAGVAEATPEPPLAPSRAEAPEREALAAPPAAEVPSTALAVTVLARESGAPLAGIQVELRAPDTPAETQPLRAAATDAAGRARFDVAPDSPLSLSTRSFDWRARDEAQEVDALAPGEQRTLELLLTTEPDVSFFGRVLDATSDAPLAGATVRLDDHGTWAAAGGGLDAPGAAETTSAADGTFEFRLRSWKPGVLRVAHAGHGAAMVSASNAHATSLEPRLVRLEREAVLDVAVTGGGGRALRARAAVGSFHLLNEAGPWNYRWLPDPSWETALAPDGTARLAGLPPRVPLVLRLVDGKALAHESAPLVLAPGETRRLEVALDAGFAIAGTATEEGDAERPAADLEVWLLKGAPNGGSFLLPFDEPYARTRTDSAGRFAFEDLEQGPWTVRPAPARGLARAAPELAAGLAQEVQLAPETPRAEVALAVWRGLFVAGRALGADGAPVRGATVFAHGPTGDSAGGSLLASCDAEGRFVLGPLVPGTYAVQGRATGAGAHTTAAMVLATAGGEDVELVFASGGSVSGRVLRPAGREQAPFWLAFQPAGGAGLPSSWSSPNPADPSFLREGLEPGTYTVIARTDDGAVGLQSGVVVEAGRETSGIELLLEPGARLALSVAPGAEAPEYAYLELWREDLYLGRGAFAPGEVWRELLPPGPLTVKLSGPEGDLRKTEELVLEVGAERVLELRL